MNIKYRDIIVGRKTEILHKPVGAKSQYIKQPNVWLDKIFTDNQV